MERKEAIEVIKKNWPDSSFTIVREALETLIPEFAELEDERIRKEIIEHIRWSFNFGNCAEEKMQRWITWLEKQGVQEQLYIRFGKIPTDEKSKIYQGEIEVGTENGVSVYPAFKTDEGDIVLGLNLPITKTTLHTQQHLIEYDDRPCYLVKGNYVGKDTDGQPLINNVSIIEKINSYRVKEEKQGEQKPADKSDSVLNILNKENQEVQQGDLIKKPSLINVRENEMVLSDVISILDNGFMPSSMERARLVKGLQSIKSQSNPAWSEEDKKFINEIEESLLAYKIIVMDNDRELANYIEKEINWLKFIKGRYTWKPSEEQMIAINTAINVLGKGTLNGKQLIELQKQLKKLKG